MLAGDFLKCVDDCGMVKPEMVIGAKFLTEKRCVRKSAQIGAVVAKESCLLPDIV